MTFGQNLQKHRKEKRLSQEALANQLFVTRQSVSQWENDRTMPSVDLLLKLTAPPSTRSSASPKPRAFRSRSLRLIF